MRLSAVDEFISLPSSKLSSRNWNALYEVLCLLVRTEDHDVVYKLILQYVLFHYSLNRMQEIIL